MSSTPSTCRIATPPEEPSGSDRTPSKPHPGIADSASPRQFPPDKPENPLWQLLERLAATAAFLFFLPLMIAIAIYIKLGTKGPAIFRQDRVGKGGKTFKFIKFRSMYVDARERFPELYAYSYSPEELDTFKFKVKNDPRVTPQGRWLRKSSLDELPNFWNVMTGTMALTGPRPEIPEMLPYYEGEMLEKFTVLPGVTGLAQASGRGELSFRDTVALDLENVRRRSPWFTIKILFRSLWKVLQRDGAF